MKYIFIFFFTIFYFSESNAQLNRGYFILSKNLANGLSTTNFGGASCILSKELNYGVNANQRLNFELNENSSISVGLGIQITTSLPIKISSSRDIDLRGMGSFGFAIPFELNYNYGCQSIIDNNDNFGFFGGIGYAFASLPKYIDGDYYDSGSMGLYPNLGVMIGFSEKTQMGIKLFSILNTFEGLHPAIGLNIFFITKSEYGYAY